MVSIRKMLVCLLTVAMLWVSPKASALHLEIWNGSAWVNSGNVSYSGPVSLTFLGIVLPCNSNWSLTISGGAGNVSSMTESGSAACSGTIAQNLPWATTNSNYSGPNPPFVDSPTLTLPLYAIQITGVRIYVPAPFNWACPGIASSGTINGYMDSGGGIVFKTTIGACTFQTQRNSRLIPDKPVRVVI
ncbi:hypothetical protein [Lysobacter enzymogenes]|uniref:hypothetical protein n=1 Tax=Lysobacter enzymogenes TaxID=69 RepID=UPI001116C187|nr:hypothetical protein [Lysobacter enzymogenes]UZW62374.1 hypothetical protein BV903_008830 [Lysobacter enzymogenes]